MAGTGYSIRDTVDAWLPPVPLKDRGHYRLGNYPHDRVAGQIARKYLTRNNNLKRAWRRICLHMPEITVPGTRYELLEFSTAHGAFLELAAGLGHRAEGTDFAFPAERTGIHRQVRPGSPVFARRHDNPVAEPVEGWVYQPVIESIGATVTLFDGGVLPYPYADDSFDIVSCYQAIEAYGPPERWTEFVRDMCRIARRAVVLGFNPPGPTQESSGDWVNAAAGWEALRRFDRDGFRTVAFGIGGSARGLHPVFCKIARGA